MNPNCLGIEPRSWQSWARLLTITPTMPLYALHQFACLYNLDENSSILPQAGLHYDDVREIYVYNKEQQEMDSVEHWGWVEWRKQREGGIWGKGGGGHGIRHKYRKLTSKIKQIYTRTRNSLFQQPLFLFPALREYCEMCTAFTYYTTYKYLDQCWNVDTAPELLVPSQSLCTIFSSFSEGYRDLVYVVYDLFLLWCEKQDGCGKRGGRGQRWINGTWSQ